MKRTDEETRKEIWEMMCNEPEITVAEVSKRFEITEDQTKAHIKTLCENIANQAKELWSPWGIIKNILGARTEIKY